MPLSLMSGETPIGAIPTARGTLRPRETRGSGQVGDGIDLSQERLDRGEAKRVPRGDVDPLLPHANRFRLVGIGGQLALPGTRLAQDGEELVGGQIIELSERPVGRLVVRNLGSLEPAAVGEPVKILARTDAEIHVRDVDPISRVWASATPDGTADARSSSPAKTAGQKFLSMGETPSGQEARSVMDCPAEGRDSPGRRLAR